MNDLLTTLKENGLVVDALAITDTIERCYTSTTKQSGKKNGWYVAHTWINGGKDYTVCTYGDWAISDKPLGTYKSWGDDKKLSDTDRAAMEKHQAKMQRKLEAEKKKLHKEAATKATAQWQGLAVAGNSQYLTDKVVKPYGIKYGNDAIEGGYIAIPFCDHDGGIKGLQLIYDNPLSYDSSRNKTFTKGVEKKGHFHAIGNVSELSPLCFVEGYATGASVHETTGYPVIVCFDAGNLKPVIEVWRKKYPTQKFIICADNDQWKQSNTGIDKASEAAKAHNCSVAIPDFTGLDVSNKPTDFNDLHTLAGGDCVKSIIHNAAKVSTPKTESVTVTAGYFNTDRGLSAGYPAAELLPCYRVYDDWLKVDDNTTLKPGTYLHHAKKDNDGLIVGIFNSRMCSPLYIESVTLDQHHHNYGRFLRFKPTRGGFKKWCMPMALLGGSLDVLKSELLSRGVLLDFDNLKLLPRYFHHFIPTETLEVATQTGWHKGAYILPESCIGSDNYFYQSENVHTDVPYRQAGTLEQWQQHIARYCVGNPLLMLSMCCAFTGALLKPANQQGGGFHLVGESSKGKSAGLEVGCSVHGDGTYKRTWKATGNGMEATAAMFNDGFLALDEIGECNSKEVGSIIYQVANGVGKSRANRNGGAKASYQWRVMVMSNGEVSIESAMQEAGQRVKAGQLMRLLNIPIFGKHGAFNVLHDKQDGRALADHLKTASLKYYGVAGIEYLTKLVAEQRDICELAERYTVALIGGETLSSQESRAAKRFALNALAGELATEYGITGWKKGDACQAVKECFEQWRKGFGGGDTEDRQIKEAVQAYIEMYGDARFTNTSTNTDRLHGVRSGYWKDDVKGRTWLFSKSGLMEAVKGYDLKKAVSVLKACGWLILDGQGKSTKSAMFKNNETGESRFYFICFTNTANTLENKGVSEKTLINHNANTANTANTENNNSLSESSEKINTPLNNRGRI